MFLASRRRMMASRGMGNPFWAALQLSHGASHIRRREPKDPIDLGITADRLAKWDPDATRGSSALRCRNTDTMHSLAFTLACKVVDRFSLRMSTGMMSTLRSGL